MQNDKENGIAFGTERGPVSEDVKNFAKEVFRDAYDKMQEDYEIKKEKLQKRQEWIKTHWAVDGNKAIYQSDSLTIEVSCEKDVDGFKTITVDTDSDRICAHGSFTTAEIPIEVLDQIMK